VNHACWSPSTLDYQTDTDTMMWNFVNYKKSN
jgi:hypothetical protein